MITLKKHDSENRVSFEGTDVLVITEESYVNRIVINLVREGHNQAVAVSGDFEEIRDRIVMDKNKIHLSDLIPARP